MRTDQHLWSSQGFSLATSLSSKLLFTHLRRDPVCIPVHTEDQQTSFNFASSCLSLTCLKGRITLDSCSLILTQFDFHQNANKVLLSSISLEELTSKAYGSCVCKTIQDAIFSERQSTKKDKFFLFHVFQEGNIIPGAGLFWRLTMHSCCTFNNSSISECSSRDKHSQDEGSVSIL